MNGAIPVPPLTQTILLSSLLPSANFSLICRAAPVGGIHDTSLPSPELNNAVVTRPGSGFRTHLITNSMNFLFSGCEAIEYALRISLLSSLGMGMPRVMN